jgi:signal transduction histidine kinase
VSSDSPLTFTRLSDDARRGPRDEVTETARLVGLKDFHSPTLEAVERRRWQLWLVSIVFLLTLSTLITVASVWPAALATIGVAEGRLSTAAFRTLLLVLIVAFGGYTAEKETNLRRLNRLLVEERVLTAALSNRLLEVSALLDAGKAMNSVLDIEAVLDIILNSATSLLEAAGGSIMLSDEEGTSLTSVCVRGNDLAVDAVVEFDEGIAGRVAKSWEPLLVTGQSQGRHSAVDTAMCVPLIHRSQLLGVLNINGSTGRRFTEYDLRALHLFAEQAAAAIANARLYDIERRHVAELVEGELRKSEFIASVSHDLRTPLTSMMGSTKMLQRPDLSTEHRLELAAMVERQAVRLNRMVEELLATARIESDAPPPLTSVDLEPILRSVNADFEVSGQAFDIATQGPVIVQGQPDSLHRVFANLVENAFKYGAPPVTVTSAPDPDPQFVLVSVADRGRGIAPEDRDRVFQRFWRVDRSRGTPGIGLGLAIVQGLVVSCGGEVWVESPADGVGTVVQVRLRRPDV